MTDLPGHVYRCLVQHRPCKMGGGEFCRCWWEHKYRDGPFRSRFVTISDPNILRAAGWRDPVPTRVTAARSLWNLWRQRHLAAQTPG